MHLIVDFFAVIGFICVVFIGWVWADDYGLLGPFNLPQSTYRSQVQLDYVRWLEREAKKSQSHFGDGAFGPGKDLNAVDSKSTVCMTNWNDKLSEDEYREPYNRVE
jgi:hypothetical protein